MLPARVGRGVACQSVFGSYVAAIVEAEVDNDGEVAIRRVTAAVDCGTVVNPPPSRRRSRAARSSDSRLRFDNEITIAKGRVQQSNFNKSPGCSGSTKRRRSTCISCETATRRAAWASQAPLSPAPALANALFAATGARLRSLPVHRKLLCRGGPREVFSGASSLAAVALVAVAILVLEAWIVFGPGPTHFAGRRTGSRSTDYKGSLIPPAFLRASRTRASSTRGVNLIRAADREARHTAIGGRPFAGGLASVRPSGR